jgi:hypothetical protein
LNAGLICVAGALNRKRRVEDDLPFDAAGIRQAARLSGRRSHGRAQYRKRDGSYNARSAPTRSEAQVTLKGIVSVAELAKSGENLESLQNRPVEMPLHRLPSRTTLEALPLTPEPNVGVFGGIAPSFASVKGFVGLFGGENAKVNGGEFEPPDQGLAVNNNVAAEDVNLMVQFFNATTGASMAGPIAASSFFLAPFGSTLIDPQVFFDPTTSRWFFDIVVSNPAKNLMAFAVSVSQTSNPLGNYFVYNMISDSSSGVSGCGGVNCFPDYPKAGYDANGFYIAADLINGSGSFVESAIYALPKSKLEAGATFIYFRFDDPSDFVVQPSVPAPREPFSTADNGSEFLMSAPGSPNLSVLAIVNTNNIVSSGSTMRLLRATLAGQSYGVGVVPSTQPNVVGPFCKSKGVTSAPSLDGEFSAFQATIQKAGGNLYGALPFAAKDGTGFPRDVIAWFEVHPTLTSKPTLSASIVHQGLVVPGNGYSISYPAFGLNKTGASAMGMTMTNKSKSLPGGFPSAAFIQFTGSATTGRIIVSGQGATSDDGSSGCAKAGPGQIGRWGDYGAATLDARTGFFYTANEMIPDPTKFPRGTTTNWGTFITQLH